MLLWFGLVSAEPALLHACPVHSGVSASHDDPGTGHGAHGAAVAHAAHSAHASQASTGQQDAPEKHRCACIGDCSSGTSATGLPEVFAGFATGTEWIAPASIVPDDSATVTAPAFLRPYANGPPRGRRIA